MSESGNAAVADAAPAAGWYTDPMGRAEYRWFDGTEWTRRVSMQGVARSEPLRAERLSEPLPHSVGEPSTAAGALEVPPGWYEPTPASGMLRWWDGANWTEHEAPHPQAQAC